MISPDFYLGPVRIHYYGLFLAIGIFCAWVVALKSAPRFNIVKSAVESVLPWLVLGGFLGARLYYVIFSWDYFGKHLSEIFAFWHGGLAIYGGMIGGTIAAVVYAKLRGLRIISFLDLLVLGLPLGQAIGRLGNFFNQEAFGQPTNLPWRMYVAPAFRPHEFLNERFFHPTFLYEALWDIGIFFALLLFIKGKPGILVGSYLILYSLGRFFIESIRLDSFFISGIRVDQITALVAVLIGTGIIFLSNRDEKSSA